ncbi:zinc metalloproteinase-disintegrin-like ohanin [Leptopilina heterotoma]|uniref:zinc metalloproteinase-disintegrin-like ohanin n=1 Tax=Leptopilina heterotoma TaxID=63436 RepID=UPI001CA97611|nr:zinc metalloproteinase-disintegrin-like ohanin [Leptopilina heterotoma]
MGKFSCCTFFFVFINFVYAKQIAIQNNAESFNSNNLTTSDDDFLEIVYPQILIITDRKFRSFFANEAEVSKYISTYWQAVNEVYSNLTKPQVALNIAGIVQMDDFAKHNIFLTKSRKKIFQHFNPLNLEFDVAVIMSGEDVWNSWLPGTLGFSINNSACDFPNNLAVVNDNGQYKTIIVAAHELAHTFSAQHDCNVNEENVMSVLFSGSDDSKEFSICNQLKMQQFFNSKNASCLLNKPF